MSNKLTVRRAALLIGSIALCFAVSGAVVGAQDLGSANTLFRDLKKKNAKTTTKKPSPKAKTAAKAPSKKTPSKSSKTAANDPTAKVADTAKKVEIAKAKPVAPPITAAAKQLFERLVAEGNAARDDREYGAAEAAYQRAQNINPADFRAIYGLGNLYSDQLRWEEAESAYRSALELDPSNAIVHIALSYVLTQPIAAPNLGDRYAEAESLARKAIELDRSNALAYDQLGVALELRGLIGAETENAYRRAIQLDKTFAPAFAHLGRLLRRRGKGQESSTAYQNAVSLSTDVSTMVVVAEVMQSEQRYAESVPLLQGAIGGDPRNPAALIMLGRALTTQGNYNEAEQALRRSLAVSPDAFSPNSLLGSLYWRQGKFEQAETALLQAIRHASPFEKRHLSQQFEALGDGYLKAGRFANAERAYRKAVDLDSENRSVAGKLQKGRAG